MFGTVLDKLSALLSKSFLIANFFPVLLFAVGNGTMLFFLSPGFRGFVLRHYDPSTGAQALFLVVALVAVAVAAYVLSPLSFTLRQILEGQHWPGFLARWGRSRHIQIMDALRARLDLAQSNRRALDRFDDAGQRLRAARARGARQHNFLPTTAAAVAVRDLLHKRSEARDISGDEMRHAEDCLVHALESGDADIVNPYDPDHRNSTILDNAQTDFFKAWKYMDDRLQSQATQCFNTFQFSYAEDDVAPTAMGNLALAGRYYADSRYGLNLEIFWSRLQKVIQSDDKYYAVLQDAKTQLDFLVFLFWLTVAFCCIWTPLLLIKGRNYVQLLIVILPCPWFAVVCYKLAVQNYWAFADILKGSVDLFRMRLLIELHMPLPARAEEEIRLWTFLGNRLGFNNRDQNITYVHPPAP